MNNNVYEKIKKAVNIERLILGLLIGVFLFIIFFQNEGESRLIILPFLICAIANFLELLFLNFQKDKLAKIFNYVFKISFFTFVIGFLGFLIYYAIVHKEYPFLIIIFLFIIIGYLMLKDKIFKRKK